MVGQSVDGKTGNNTRAEIVDWIGKGCRENRQVYWVCPLIEESEKLEL